MVATYPDMLAGGITDLGRFDQFDLFGGGFSEHPTTQGVAADGVAIPQFAVCTIDAAGKITPFVTTGLFATGTITFGANPANADTLTLNGVAITFVTGTPTAGQVKIGATVTETAQATKALVNASPSTYGMGLGGTVNVLTASALVVGTAGNAITMAKSGAQPTLSAATLTGADATADNPSGRAFFIAAQAAAAATPGKGVPGFIGGGFNREALVWPAGIITAAQQRAIFAGTPISVHQLL